MKNKFNKISTYKETLNKDITYYKKKERKDKNSLQNEMMLVLF